MPNHLPEAESILPGHTLIRPALGMLKSAVKFPHRDLEDGAGVYGNEDTIGMKYGGRNERVLYSGFRRSPLDYIMDRNRNGQNQLMKKKRNRTGSVSEQRMMMKLFWDSQFNYMKIPQDVPNFAKLQPENQINKLRDWWFYNQDDDQFFDSNTLQ
ncbi:hypothetical protein ABMA28_011771 [Loxostege sticticalis]|uniref:Uncharacterized protein n=1 Tax=Loxostege sticticalis TaxID=481309 RepID=A0ABD0TKR0_LOXSC